MHQPINQQKQALVPHRKDTKLACKMDYAQEKPFFVHIKTTMHKKTRFLVHSLDGMLVISLFVVDISTFTAAASKLIHHHQHAAALRTVKRRAVAQQTVAIAAQTAV